MTDSESPTPYPPERVTGYPVQGFPMRFSWWNGDWCNLFNKQVELIQEDIRRARSEDRFIVYLSCPISARGGGMSITNVEIANFTARWLMNCWGSRFWVLNPAAYQLESKQGTGLIHRFAKELGIEGRLKELEKKCPAHDGDYMRMWTRVLVEDDDGKNVGGRFSAFYFVSPTDVRRFFGHSATVTLTADVENYFSSQFAINADFRDYFSLEASSEDRGDDARARWQQRRDEFIRFYSLKASAAFSKGSHDEWNIVVKLNRSRLLLTEADGYGLGSQIAAYFEGSQVDPGSAETQVSPGYEVVS
jgi:hypothetical protein